LEGRARHEDVDMMELALLGISPSEQKSMSQHVLENCIRIKDQWKAMSVRTGKMGPFGIRARDVGGDN
jgi:hypothetical protein